MHASRIMICFSYKLEIGKLHSRRIMFCFYGCFWNQCSEQQGGAVGACWARNPEVDGSKPFPAWNVCFSSVYSTFLLYYFAIYFENVSLTSNKIWYCLIQLGGWKIAFLRIMSCFYCCFWKLSTEQQGSAVEALWAHNPEVDGSKPFPAKKLSIFFNIPRAILLR